MFSGGNDFNNGFGCPCTACVEKLILENISSLHCCLPGTEKESVCRKMRVLPFSLTVCRLIFTVSRRR